MHIAERIRSPSNTHQRNLSLERVSLEWWVCSLPITRRNRILTCCSNTASSDETVQVVPIADTNSEQNAIKKASTITHPKAVRTALPLAITGIEEPYVITGSAYTIRSYDVSSPDETELLKEGKKHIMAYKGSYHTEHKMIPALEEWVKEQEERSMMVRDWVVRTLDEDPFFPGWQNTSYP